MHGTMHSRAHGDTTRKPQNALAPRDGGAKLSSESG